MRTPRKSFRYSEEFLQWLWKERLYSSEELRLNDGQDVEVINPGYQNLADGPDFLCAVIKIGPIIFHGSVEIHIGIKHWEYHKHHLDEKYNNVVLHVVTDDQDVQVYTKSGYAIPTLNLLPYFYSGIHEFYKDYQLSGQLPCSSHYKYISREALLLQIEKAHEEYFQSKVDNFFTCYNPNLVPSEAWKRALVTSLFDGLGISNNRIQMKEVANRLFEDLGAGLFDVGADDVDQHYVEKLTNGILWNLKGVRSAGRPELLVKNGLLISKHLFSLDLNDFLNDTNAELWQQLINDSNISYSGKFRILYATVYLPALFALGRLFGADKLCSNVRNIWLNYSAPIPKSLLSKFNFTSIQDQKILSSKLGSIYQLREYCDKRSCMNCEVLKKVIKS